MPTSILRGTKSLKLNTVGPLLVVLFIGVVGLASATSKVIVEYFHFSGCPECERVDALILDMQSEYSDKVSVEWIDALSPEGVNRLIQYNLKGAPAVVINHEYAILGEEITKDRLRSVIETYLHGGAFIIPSTIQISAPIAFSLGLFSMFSPCLLAMLVFILTYTTGTSVNLKGGILRASTFGLGLIAAYMLLGGFVLVLNTSITSILTSLHNLKWVVSASIIIIGLNLVDILKLPIKTKPLAQRLAKKYGFTLAGLFLLGILFSFINVPCAAPFLLILLANILLKGTLENLMLLVFFSLGVLIPFIAIGLVGGGGPSLAIRIRRQYRQRTIRIISGLVLIGFGILMLIL